jgi:hypothetical protein
MLDYSKHCKLPFGAYVEMHEENNPTNNMKERTRAAICLGPTTNFQGSYKFLCLKTGRRITSKQFKELPMPASVIKAVKALAERDKQDGHARARATRERARTRKQENNDTDDEAPGIHMEIPGVTEENMEIPGVMEEIGIPGVPENIPGVPEGTPGVPMETT